MAKFELLKKLTSVPQTQADPLQGEGGTVVDAEVVPIARESGRASRIGAWALGLGVGVFLLWAAFAPLDEGMPSPGQVAIDTNGRPRSVPR